MNSAVFCQCFSNTPSCSSHLRAADSSPTHPPAGSLRNDKRQVGSAAPAAVGPSGTLKTNDNVLGALCRIMKMYPCAPSESERHQHFKSADPSRRNPPPASPPSPAANGSGGDGEHQSPGARRRAGGEKRRGVNDSFISARAPSRPEERMGLQDGLRRAPRFSRRRIVDKCRSRRPVQVPRDAAGLRLRGGKRWYLATCFFTSAPTALLLSSRASKSAMFAVRKLLLLLLFFCPTAAFL